MLNKEATQFFSLGYITREEFCKLCGRADGGSIIETAKNRGVRMVQIPLKGDKNRFCTLLHRDDVPLMKEPNRTLFGGGNTGGVLRHEINELKNRISLIENELGISCLQSQK